MHSQKNVPTNYLSQIKFLGTIFALFIHANEYFKMHTHAQELTFN